MASQRRTQRQRRGGWAEDIAARYLAGLGWQILGRNIRVGRDEIDIVALQGGETPTLVTVEVRGLHSSAFGAPEERVDRRKVSVLYRAAGALRAAGEFAGEPLRAGHWRVDLVVVDARDGPVRIRHLRSLEPP